MAGLGRKEWSPGDTLTAADVNGYLMDQSVMVFAGTAARASAIPSPSTGMVSYSTATNLQYYNGSTWVTVGTTPGLVYVAGASFTAQSTVSMAAGVFTSTYKNYQVFLDVTSVSTQLQIAVRVNNAGSPRTGASYFWGTGLFNTSGTYTGTGSGSSATPYIMGADSTRGCHGQINVFDPTNASSYTEVTAASNGNISGTTGSIFGGFFYNAAEANDGLTFVTSTGTMTGFYRVYGMSES